MAQDATPTVSSTVDPHTSSDTLRALSPEDRAKWRMTGELPTVSTTTDPVKPARDADSPPAEVADPPVSTETRPEADSEPAGKDLKSRERFEALSATAKTEKARADRLQQQLDAMMATPASKTDATPAESSPVTTGTRAEAQAYQPDLAAPLLTDDEFAEKFPEAKFSDYNRYVVRYELAADRATVRTVSAADARRSSFGAQVQAEIALDGDFSKNVLATDIVKSLVPVDALKPGTAPTALNHLAQEILVSSSATALLRHFVAHPDDLTRIADSGQIARELGKLEGKLDAAQVTRTAKADAAPEPVSSKAPVVPDTVGRKPSVESDPVAAALDRKDFTAFRNAANAADFARAGIR